MNEEQCEQAMRRIESKFKGNNPIYVAQKAICNHLLLLPDHEATFEEIEAISKPILEQHKIKINVKNLVSHEEYFSVTDSKIAKLLVEKLLEGDIPRGFNQQEQQLMPSNQSFNQALTAPQPPIVQQEQTGGTSQEQYQVTPRAHQQNFQSQPQQFFKQQQPQIQQQQQSRNYSYQPFQSQQAEVHFRQAPQQQQRQYQPHRYSSQNNRNFNRSLGGGNRNQQYHRQKANQKFQFDFSQKEIKSITELQDLRDFFDQNRYKSVGLDMKVWNQFIGIISLSVHEKGSGEGLVAKSWFIDFYSMSIVDRNNAVSILAQIWENRIVVVQDIASFGRQMYKHFHQRYPPQLIDLQVLFQGTECQQKSLGGDCSNKIVQKDGILWKTKDGKPALYGMLFRMELIPVVKGFEETWRHNRVKPKWVNRPLAGWQLDVIKEDVCFLLPLCDAIKKRDREFVSNALINLSKAHMFWQIPQEERGDCESQTFDRIELLQESVEYEMKFAKDTSDKYPRYIPSFTTFSATSSFSDLQGDEMIQQVSLVVGQEYLDVELESVLKILPDRVSCAILKHLVPEELLLNGTITGDRQMCISKSLQNQKNLIEIIFDDGDEGITLRTRDDDQITVPCKVHIAEFIEKIKNAEIFVKQDLVVKQLIEDQERVIQDEDEGGGRMEQICKLKQDSDGGHPPFRADNRLGLPGTLHRVSVIFGPTGHDVSGIIYRIGRHLLGAALPFMDLLSQIAESQLKHGDSQSTSLSSSLQQLGGKAPTPSILVMGQPGVGKTTLLRDIAYQLSDGFGLGKAVCVVDSSLEMGGESRIPHACLGKSRRVAVAHRSQQYVELRNVVQNMNPRVIVVDEIRDSNEVKTIRDISQRGVVMIATIHCPDLPSLLTNNVLKDLVGGVKPVTLGDTEAKHSNQGVKTRLERAGAPVFQTLIEVQSSTRWKVHPNVAVSVDNSLLNSPVQVQVRRFVQDKQKVMFKLEGELKDDATQRYSSGTWMEELISIKRSLNLP